MSSDQIILLLLNTFQSIDPKLNDSVCGSFQIHLRFEMEMERMKQIHQKELEDKDEELEDVQKSSQRRVRNAE